MSARRVLPLRRRRAARISTSIPARASPASVTTIPTCARCCRPRSPRTSWTACSSTIRRLAGMLAEALSQRLPRGLDAVFFASTRRRGRRLGDEVRARGDRSAAPDLLREQLSRRHPRAALAGRRRVLQGGLRPAAPRLRTRSVRRPRPAGGGAAREGRRRLHRRADPGPHGDAAACGLSAGRAGAVPALRHAVRRSTRSRPGSAAPAGGSRSSTGDSSRTSCSSARRSAAATCRSPRWSRRREIYQQAVGTLERCYVHQSTYGRNRLSMAAGLATLRDHRTRSAGRARRARSAPCCSTGSPSSQQRYEMIKEVRGSGLMIGIELCAPSSRVARLNWRLIHMASEGLFPQLIVIPLHRDHGVITMAAGKNDVIKLLPPLTLSESEAQQLPRRARRGARRLPRRRGQELGRRTRHRHRDAAPPGRARARRRRGGTPLPRHAASTVARRGLPGHRRDRVHRRAPGAAAGRARAIRCAASCARAATPRCSTSSMSRSPSATSPTRDR